MDSSVKEVLLDLSMDSSVKEVLLDLRFINDIERKTILSVINRDIKFNKESMSFLENSIHDKNEKRNQISRNEDKCFCSQSEYNTCFSKFLARQCYQCEIFLCKSCIQHLQRRHLCSDCLKERIFNFQLSITAVFYSDEILSPLYGSKLVKISLENKTTIHFQEDKSSAKNLTTSLQLMPTDPEIGHCVVNERNFL